MTRIFPWGNVTSKDICEAAEQFGTPLYLYDEFLINEKCAEIRELPHAFGIFPRYAMKANSNKTLLQLIHRQGLGIDASSLNEVRRANMAGISFKDILLTSQEVPEREERARLESMIEQGLRYNVCSMRQLFYVSSFARERKIPLSIRIHPGTGGSGESITRDTASPYSCFGVHLTVLEHTLKIARDKKVVFERVHDHIGSGGSPEKWRKNVDTLLAIIEKNLDYFPQLKIINFGGGLKEARMPDEVAADAGFLGQYAKEKLEEFAKRTGKELVMEIEPGTYIIARAGNLITKVIDQKSTGPDGYNFLVLDGGMEVNSRPLLYGSRHPFAVVTEGRDLLSYEYDVSELRSDELFVPVGRCCESGDSQSLDSQGNIVPRLMATPNIGDYVVIGATGAYCSSMTPFNYNSYVQAPEALKRTSGKIELIRERQTLEQMTSNEIRVV